MNNKFAEVIKEESNIKETENGAMSYKRLDSQNLTLFGIIGAMRSRSEEEIVNEFSSAFNENAELATRMLFYAGDIRGGLGERRTFRVCLRWLAFNYPSVVIDNILMIPYYNRFDTWYSLVGTPVESKMWQAMRTVWQADNLNFQNGDNVSLLSKWMKSINASSAETRALGIKTMKELKFPDEKSYRKALSIFRGRIRVIEKQISANRWNNIDYSTVPSYAMKKYKQAFYNHTPERFAEFLEEVSVGNEKINAGVLYPYDLVEELMKHRSSQIEKKVIEEQWKALPNYLEDSQENILVMADVSASMYGRPMATSIGLAIYFAERNNGAFKNTYMTFTDRPSFIHIAPNDTLAKKVQQVKDTDIGYSTNLENAFDKILKTAVNNNIPVEDMPKALVVISDNEIDSFNVKTQYGNSSYNLNFVESMTERFEQAGYNLPKIIFWQVESRQNTFLAKSEQALWISGQSAGTFKNLIKGINLSSYELMYETLYDKRYDNVKISKEERVN